MSDEREAVADEIVHRMVLERLWVEVLRQRSGPIAEANRIQGEMVAEATDAFAGDDDSGGLGEMVIDRLRMVWTRILLGLDLP